VWVAVESVGANFTGGEGVLVQFSGRWVTLSRYRGNGHILPPLIPWKYLQNWLGNKDRRSHRVTILALAAAFPGDRGWVKFLQLFLKIALCRHFLCDLLDTLQVEDTSEQVHTLKNL
jgi:hypothetical protein